MKCTDSNMLLVLARSQYVHENNEFSLQSFLSKQFMLLQHNFHICDGKSIFAHLRGSCHMYRSKKSSTKENTIEFFFHLLGN